MNKRHFGTLALLVALVLFVSVWMAGNALSQEVAPGAALPPPGAPPGRPMESAGPPPLPGAVQTADGLWMMPATGEEAAAPQAPRGSGGPDDYGYTWDDTVPLNWISAAGGVETGIGDSVDHVGPVPIGFNFNYYENSYSQLYISRYGFVAFNDNGIFDSQSEIPYPGLPNDVIAPHWVPAYDVNGYVRYLQGGTAPNRWFLVEWNRLESDCCSGNDVDEYTFEVILYESGDILFQYNAMVFQGGWVCQSSGIEDARGVDGLAPTGFCQQVSPYHAVRFDRPAPAARVLVWPEHYGQFVRAGEVATATVPIRNTGELGTDVYDLPVSSAWPVTLYAGDGVTPLTDTDSDGIIDTGPVSQGVVTKIVVAVTTPGAAALGANNTATITARSSLNTNVEKAATVRTAVPAPFAQHFRAPGAEATLLLAHPAGRELAPVAEGQTAFTTGYRAVAETPDHEFINVWARPRCVANCQLYVYELMHARLDRFGDTVLSAQLLTNHSNVAMYTYDRYPAVAVAPNGNTGILWQREQYNSSTGQSNYNIHMAILSDSGDIIYGPVRVTNNNSWGGYSDVNVPRFYGPQIAATGDNRFILAWQRMMYADPASCPDPSCPVDDVYYAVRSAGGAPLKPPTNFTGDTPGYDNSYRGPGLTALTGNKALLAFTRSGGAYYDIFFGVVDSNGNVLKGKTALSTDGGASYDYDPDATQLSNGNILVGWTGSTDVYRTRYALLNSSYTVIMGPATLQNPAALLGDRYVSVTGDGSGHGILSWMDANYPNHLYYALVSGSNGSLLTPPTIFYTGSGVYTSWTGYANTTYSWTPPAGVDGIVSMASTLNGGEPGTNATIVIEYANHGAALATGLQLVATLDAALTYVGDTSGITPTVSGNTVTWDVPDQAFLDSKRFTLWLAVPGGAAYGDLFPVSLSLTANEPDVNPGDNTTDGNVLAAHQVHLPTLSYSN